MLSHPFLHFSKRFGKGTTSQILKLFCRCVTYQNTKHYSKAVACCHSYTFSQKHVLRKQWKTYQPHQRSDCCYSLDTSKKPFTMKLDSEEFHNIFTPELNYLSMLFTKYNYELRIAGGAVRDLLSGKQPHDLDFATTATPSQMKDMFQAENVRMLNTKGEKHGTITARINDKMNFEVTTLRIDVMTDGRHAQVMFVTDWYKDANRRDLTVNSMFLGLDGTVYDYFNGIEDLKNKRVAFVGDPAKRIQEDYLRILRYFRFYGRIAAEPNNHEEHTVSVIRDNCDGLAAISGERIWMELKKILSGNYAGELLQTLLEIGIAPHIGLPDAPDIEELQRVWLLSGHLKLEPMTLMAALLKDTNEVMTLHGRLKLSAYERDLGLFVVIHREDKPSEKPLRPYQFLLVDAKNKITDVRKWICEVLKYRHDVDLLEQFTAWKVPRFPVNGHMLSDRGVRGGKQFSFVTEQLKKTWRESDFTLTQEQLLEKLPEILNELESKSVRD